MSERPKRALAPKPTEAGENLGSAHEQLSRNPKQADARRRPQGITSVACEPCRRRRSKCDGRRPVCDTCLKKSTTDQCTWEASNPDERVGNLRGRIQELEAELGQLRQREAMGSPGSASSTSFDMDSSTQDPSARASFTTDLPYHPSQRLDQDAPAEDHATSLVQLYSTLAIATQDELSEISLRCRNNERVSSILEAHRQGRLATSTSHSQPARAIRQPNAAGLEWGNPSYTASDTDVASEATYPPYPAYRAFDYDGPIVTIGDDGTRRVWWSRVTTDENLINELLSLYFQWVWPIYQHVPRDLFLQDYNSGNTDFCCQALVNAILACACKFSTRNDVYSGSGNLQTRGLNFLEEARYLACRRLDSTGPIAATFLVMCHVEFDHGRREAYWTNIGIGARMTLSHRFMALHAERSDMEHMTPLQLLYHRQVFWAASNLDQMGAWALGRLSQIPRTDNLAGLPEIIAEEDAIPWSFNGRDYAGCFSSCFHYFATLSNICNLQSQLFYARASALTSQNLLSIHDRYNKWFATLPAILTPPLNKPPHVLALHMYAHSATLLLFQPFVKASLNGSNIVPSRLCKSHADSIATIFVHWHELYSSMGMNDLVVQTVRTASVIQLLLLPSPSARLHLRNIIMILREHRPRSIWADDTLQMMLGLVGKWNIQLPQDAQDMLGDIPMSRNSATNINVQLDLKGKSLQREELSKRSESFGRKMDGFASSQVDGESSLTGGPTTVRDMLFSPFPEFGPPIVGAEMTLAQLEMEAGIIFSGDTNDPFMGYEDSV